MRKIMTNEEFEEEVERIVKGAYSYLDGSERLEPAQCNVTLSTVTETLAELARSNGIKTHQSTPILLDTWTDGADNEPAIYNIRVSYPSLPNRIYVHILPRI